ncbi:(3S,6E)-nerolidol synthase 1-like [Lycium barbarum]|uniref:(3S,6E)-nerolidol synthase 1-like n=1 Tax=Lycium barbarum TaxID=112863 RepID=UPI00293F2C4D|nr:(3S,6E)-nerolidol synthase 1-like [Lycium barbarum]
MNHYCVDYKEGKIPFAKEVIRMWKLKETTKTDSVEPNRYQAGCKDNYVEWTLRWIREEEERIAANKETAIKCVIIDMTGGNVMEKLHESSALEGFGLNGIYLTVSEAVADISSLWKNEPELSDVKYAKKVEQLEKYLDIVKEQNQLQALVIIDVIQQLSLDHLFHQQIQLILEQQYLKTKTAHFYRHSDLYEVSLRFRLLRQEGYNVPAEVFNNFKRENESFQDELRQDLKGLVALHEATHLIIKGEGILVEAAQFSGECLIRNMVYLDDNQSNMARQTLQHPIHKNLPRYSIRSSLEEFQVGDEWEAMLKDLAFIEFGKLQSIYKEEKSQVLN